MGVDTPRRERYEMNFVERRPCVNVCCRNLALAANGCDRGAPRRPQRLICLYYSFARTSALFPVHATAPRPLHLHAVTARPRVLAHLRLPPGAFVSNSLIGIDYHPHAPAASHSFRPLQHAPASLVEPIRQHSLHVHYRQETPLARPDLAATAQHSAVPQRLLQQHPVCTLSPSRWYRTRALRFGYSYREYRSTP